MYYLPVCVWMGAQTRFQFFPNVYLSDKFTANQRKLLFPAFNKGNLSTGGQTPQWEQSTQTIQPTPTIHHVVKTNQIEV